MQITNYFKYFLGTAVLFTFLVLSIKPCSYLVRTCFSDNYAWQAKRAADAGKLRVAEQILKSQMPVEHYDFTLHQLYAEAIVKQRRPLDAIKVLKLSIDRERAVSGRKVFNRGYNSYKSHEMLSQLLTTIGDDTAARLASKRANDKFMLRGEGILSIAE